MKLEIILNLSKEYFPTFIGISSTLELELTIVIIDIETIHIRG